MRLLYAVTAIAFFPLGANAEGRYFVSVSDVDACSTMSNFSRVIAEARDKGDDRTALSLLIPSEVSTMVRNDLLDIVQKTGPGDPGYVAKVTAALCLLERLKPQEAK